MAESGRAEAGHSHSLGTCATLDELSTTTSSKAPELTYTKCYTQNSCWLVITPKQAVIFPDIDPVQSPRLCLTCNGTASVTYLFQVLFKTIESGVCDSDRLDALCQQMLPSSPYVVCPGIPSYPDDIRFKTEHLHEWGQPFSRLDSDLCALWHIPNNARQLPTSSLYNACKQCKQLWHDIQQLAKRSSVVSPGQKLARTSVSSSYPLKYLSPASANKRVSKISKAKKNLQARVESLKPFDCELDNKQHSELLRLVTAINGNSRAIEQLCTEGDKVVGCENNLLREAWRQDVTERIQFEQDQSLAVTGDRGNRWSQITLRMGICCTHLLK